MTPANQRRKVGTVLNVILTPGRLHGTAAVPPSKSVAHRAVVCAALAAGTSRIENIAYSDDIRATIGADIVLSLIHI